MLLLFGSYRQNNDSVGKNSFLICITVFLCGILSAIAVFMYSGHLAHMQNLDLKELNLSGSELTFVIFPMALNLMPLSNIMSLLFYFMMLCLGVDTMFAFVEYLSNDFEQLIYEYFAKYGIVPNALVEPTMELQEKSEMRESLIEESERSKFSSFFS